MPNDDINKFVSNKYYRGNLKIAHFDRFFLKEYISIEWLKSILSERVRYFCEIIENYHYQNVTTAGVHSK